MGTKVRKSEFEKSVDAKCYAEEIKWVKHCNGHHRQMTEFLGRAPTDGEWLNRFDKLVEGWK